MTHWETKREILCDESDVTLRHRAPYTLSLFKVSIAQLNPCRANNRKSAHIKITGYPRVLACHRVSQSSSCHFLGCQHCFPGQQRGWTVATQVMLLWGEMELGYLFSPLCWEHSEGESSCPWKSSVGGTLYLFSITSSMMGMYKCNTLAEGMLAVSLLQPEQN